MYSETEIENLYNALTQYFDAIELAQLVSKHSISELKEILLAKKNEAARNDKGPYKQRWGTKDLTREEK